MPRGARLDTPGTLHHVIAEELKTAGSSMMLTTVKFFFKHLARLDAPGVSHNLLLTLETNVSISSIIHLTSIRSSLTISISLSMIDRSNFLRYISYV